MNKISHTIFAIITSNIHVYLSNTELIFWGYGDKELFPSYYSFIISSAFDNKIKWTPKSGYQVSNINVACIEPFAQTDVANTVVRGIDDDLRSKFYEGYKKSIDIFKTEIIYRLEEVNAPTELIDVLTKIDTQTYVESYMRLPCIAVACMIARENIGLLPMISSMQPHIYSVAIKGKSSRSYVLRTDM